VCVCIYACCLFVWLNDYLFKVLTGQTPGNLEFVQLFKKVVLNAEKAFGGSVANGVPESTMLSIMKYQE